jgi:hypothetical protein
MTDKKREQAPLKFHVPAATELFQQALEKLEKGQQLTAEEDDLSLTPAETAQVLSIIKGSPVSARYVPEMIRLGKIEPAMRGPGRSYLYRMQVVRQVKFNPQGRPSGKTKQSKTDA